MATAPRPPSSWSFGPERDVVAGSMDLYDGLHGRAVHSRTVVHDRAAGWFLVVDGVSSDRGGRSVEATWHAHPNATVRLLPPGQQAAILDGVAAASGGRPTGAQLAIVPATGQVHAWSSLRVAEGERAGVGGAHEDQGWFSAGYDDPVPSPTLVYGATLGAGEKHAVFAWLLLPSPVPFPAGGVGATAAVTSVREGGTVAVTVATSAGGVDVVVELEGFGG